MDGIAIKCLLLFATISKAMACIESFNPPISFNNDVAPEFTYFTREKSPSHTRIRAVKDARNVDFVLGGLFPIHSDIAGGACGAIRRTGGLDRVEAMLFAIDAINSDSCLLPNITLGYDIRDTCFVEQIGLDEAADLLLSGTGTSVETGCGGSSQQAADIANNTRTQPYTIGLIGAASSAVSISIASLTRLFSFPQISYSSTSAILGNRERYSYFYRTIPSDTMEVMAILDLIEHFGWNYISTVFSRNSYGQSGIDDLHMLAADRGICIDFNDGIEETFTTVDYQRLAERLLKSTADVVVLYSTQEHAHSLINQVANLSTSRHFTWIATSAWAQSAIELPHLSAVSGLFGTIPLFKRQSHFQDYYSRLTPLVNPRNPWLPEYFESVLNCTGACLNQTSSPLADREQEYSIPLVIDAVYTYAYALEKYLNDSCEYPLVWNRSTNRCNGQKVLLDGSGLRSFIAGVDFTSPTGNSIVFNERGSVQALYEVINLQAHINEQGAANYSFRTIGIWNSSMNHSVALQISRDPQYGIDDSSRELISGPIRSECGICTPGEYARKVKDSCCGLCEKCLGELFSNISRAPQCSNCSLYGEMWGDNSTHGSTGCIEIPKLYLKFSHPFAIIVSIGSVTGLLLLLTACVLLGIYWKTPVMMASSRESVVLVLIGAGCSFVSSFIYLSPPSLTICTLQRILLWFCFSLMYGALLVKIVRIARIFILQKSSMKKLLCVQTYHQVLFSLLIVAGQMLIVLLSVSIVHPAILREPKLNTMNPDSLPEIVVTCQPEPLISLIASVLYEAGLILITVVLGTMTFKSPANFNESKAICVSAYILLSIWTMFFVSYIFTESVQYLQNAFIALTNTLGAYAILGSVIGPRLFIVIFWKERNSKHFSRRAAEGDPYISRDNLSSTSGGLTLDTVVNTAITPSPSMYTDWDQNGNGNNNNLKVVAHLETVNT